MVTIEILGRPIVIVISALTASALSMGPSDGRPDGISSEITFRSELLILLIISRCTPEGGPLKPVPNMASTIIPDSKPVSSRD